MKGRTILFLLLPLACATAQHDPRDIVPNVRVHLVQPEGTCSENADVTLAALNGPLLRGTRDNRCHVDFANVPEGKYRVDVSGFGITNADPNSNIYVSSNSPTDFEIAIQPRSTPGFGAIPGSTFVSASDLAVPSRARKELDRSNELIQKGEIKQAIDRLNKAIAIYPQYALAYNNLGVLYSRLGDRVHENEVLQKAISVNPNFALAYVNLGRMDMQANDYAAAEAAFSKALSFNPTDEITLILLSYSEFMDRSFDQAIATSRKAHALDRPHAFAHRVAARAFEEQKKGANAIAELEMFLKEEPSSSRADDARHEIEVVKSALPNSELLR
jgi:tetratricopeptide (TPR) repeat protein